MQYFDARRKMQIDEIVSPVSLELRRVDSELKTILERYAADSGNNLSRLVPKNPERTIRQAMLLLPSKALGKRASDNELVRLCAAAELMYSGVILHDSLGETGKLDAGMSLLSGDALNTMALLAVSEILPEKILLDAVKMIEKASYIKISDELKALAHKSAKDYTDFLENRSSLFAGTFAFLGAYVAEANTGEIPILEKIGMNLGVAYQIIYDCRNCEKAVKGFDAKASAGRYLGEAKSLITGFRDSMYKKSLLKLISFFNMSFYNERYMPDWCTGTGGGTGE